MDRLVAWVVAVLDEILNVLINEGGNCLALVPIDLLLQLIHNMLLLLDYLLLDHLVHLCQHLQLCLLQFDFLFCVFESAVHLSVIGAGCKVPTLHKEVFDGNRVMHLGTGVGVITPAVLAVYAD